MMWSDELLVEFFDFYTDFNFAEHGISVLSGSVVEKLAPDCPMYVENPLERDLNVTKNVLEGHLPVFRTQCQLARDALRKSSAVPQLRRKFGEPWGLLGILKTDDQLLLTEAESLPTQTTADEDVEDVLVPSTLRHVAESNRVGQTPQSHILIQDILRDTNDETDDSVADNASGRTL